MNYQYVIIACPRCRQRTCRVFRHECSRFVCSGPDCPAFEAQCENPRCEYPMPKGFNAWPSDVSFWAYGRWVSEQARRIWDTSINPIEPLPPPYNGRK